MWYIWVPAVQSDIVYPTCLKNTKDVYQEFCLAYSIYGSPSLQSVWLGKLYHLWLFWLLHGHWNVGMCSGTGTEWGGRTQDSGPSPAPQFTGGTSLHTKASTFDSSFLLWEVAVLDWMTPDIPPTPSQHWSKWITWGQTTPFDSLVTT